MTLYNFQYDPRTDPKALFAQGARNMVGGLLQGQQRSNLIDFAGNIDTNANPMQVMVEALKANIDPRTAMGFGSLQQRNRMSSYQQLRAPLIEAQTEAFKARAKQELPDRMLRQADRYLRVVDDIMSEYWYTPEGAYRDKLLKDAQAARKKAVDLIDKYGATSENSKASIQQLNKLDEEIKSAGGKVDPNVNVEPTAEDLEKYRRMGLKEYTSPSGKKYPFSTTDGLSLSKTTTTPPTGADILRNQAKSSEPTEAEINSVLEGLSGQERLKVFQEGLGLKSIWGELTTEEKLTAYKALSQGKTAQEVIDYFSKQE